MSVHLQVVRIVHFFVAIARRCAWLSCESSAFKVLLSVKKSENGPEGLMTISQANVCIMVVNAVL